MNRQPFGTPPRWWGPKLAPWWVEATRTFRWRELQEDQRIEAIDATGLEIVREAVDSGAGVMIAPNHSAHYDSSALYCALDRIDLPTFFLVAWQVFATCRPFDVWALQHHGCFSIDRESADRQALKQAIRILQSEPYPLVVFPEGDIYHVSDQVTPFREGAAAMALTAANRADRPIRIVPCGIKFAYVEDPLPKLLETMARLEERLFIRTGRSDDLVVRVHALGEALLALKELEHLGATGSGRLRDRVPLLMEELLRRLEDRYPQTARGDRIPERVKSLRREIIQHQREHRRDPAALRRTREELDDLFLVMQLYSYPMGYVAPGARIERLAETIDKFEEDVLEVSEPSVKGRRRIRIHFGPPIEVVAGQRGREAVAELTRTMEREVQSLLDAIGPRQEET